VEKISLRTPLKHSANVAFSWQEAEMSMDWIRILIFYGRSDRSRTGL